MKKLLIALLIASSLTMTVNAQSDVPEDTYLSEEIQGYCVEVGEEYGICPELLMAIIETESAGVADAENGNCKGLCQVSDKWHKERMEKLGVDDLFESYGNILVATDYLSELAKNYVDIGLVLHLYNGDSRAWKFAESGELSNYAEKILNRSAELERLHGK